MQFIDLKSQYIELKGEIDKRIQTVLDHGQYIMGPEVLELETRLCEYTEAKHCITVASGTEALLIALMAIGIKAGDEIITTAFSFIAAAEVIALLGAKPVFVDIENETCNINASLIKEKITNKTKAIIPVSLYGQPADMDEINLIANEHNIAVIEDAAQSFGAEYKGRKSCNLSRIACTSFFPSKPLGCYGDGGAIFTNDDKLNQVIREIRIHGQSERYIHSRIGVGGRMDTIQCAVVLAKLDKFDEELKRRNEIGGLYNRAFFSKVDFIKQKSDRTSVYAQYTIFVKKRELFQENLKNLGIPTAIHYPVPIHLQEAYKRYCCFDCCPVALNVSKEVISLPMGPYLNDLSINKVIHAVLANI